MLLALLITRRQCERFVTEYREMDSHRLQALGQIVDPDDLIRNLWGRYETYGLSEGIQVEEDDAIILRSALFAGRAISIDVDLEERLGRIVEVLA